VTTDDFVPLFPQSAHRGKQCLSALGLQDSIVSRYVVDYHFIVTPDKHVIAIIVRSQASSAHQWVNTIVNSKTSGFELLFLSFC
jgi:hypothetical protein